MSKKLKRSGKDKLLGGVCAGIAEYYGWDASLVRIAYVLLSVISAAFPGILVYLLLWIIIPPES